jgi:pimeloyl-ACP methyl ester carboxylesterase
MFKVLIVSAFIMILAFALSGDRMHEPAEFENMVRIGSHNLFICCQGKGSPVVVFEAGSGVSSINFIPIQKELAKTTRACRYDRAGYRPSEAAPAPRDAGREVDELHTLSAAAAVESPYVLVGHSLGALNVQVFASRYSQEVAGMVLIDPPPLDWLLGKRFTDLREMALAQTDEWQSMADQADQSSEKSDQESAVFLRAIASEFREMFGETVRLLVSIDAFGDLPLAVIASEKANPQFGEEAEAYQQLWIEQSRLLAQKSFHGSFILAAGCSHLIYEDNPDLVVKTIQQIIETARAGDRSFP